MRLMIAALVLVLLILIDRAWYGGKYASAVSYAISQTVYRL
jgi:hypothetical protein